MATRNKYIIKGRIIDIKTKQGIAGLRIEAWDKDLLIDDLIGSTRTDRRGYFQIDFTISNFSELFLDRMPDLYFKVFDSFKLIKSTEEDLLWNIDLGKEEIIIEIENVEEIEKNNTQFLVKGRITIGDEIPARGVLVKAFNQSLKRQLRLGETTANRNGEYEIHYETKYPLDTCLIVCVYELKRGKEIGSSKMIFGVKKKEVIDVSIDRMKHKGLSELEHLLEYVNIERKDISITNLDERQIEYIAAKTGSDLFSIKLIQNAHKLADETRLPAEMFYAFGKQDIVLSIDSILTQNHKTLRKAFEVAAAENIISEKSDKSVDELFERLQEYTVYQELNGKSLLGAILLTSKKLTNIQREAYLIAKSQYEGPNDDFWDELAKCPVFKGNGGIEELKLTIQMGKLALNHLPMVNKLQEYHRKGTLQSLKDLAKWDRNKWHNEIKLVGVPPEIQGENEECREESYIDKLLSFIYTAYPTQVIEHMLDNDEQPIKDKGDLLQFLQDNPDFELGKTHIDSYLDVDAEDELKILLKSWQRVYRISPTYSRYDAMRELKKKGLDSAQSIVRLGHDAFVEKYSQQLGGSVIAEEIWDRSCRVAAIALTQFALNSKALNVPQELDLLLIAAETDIVLIWEEIFGSQNLCDCEHCKSILFRPPIPYFYSLRK